MISIPQSLIETMLLPGVLAAIRVIGLFLSAPFFALQVIPGRFRTALAMVLALGIPVQIGALTSISINTSTSGLMFLAATELLLGLAMGWIIRVGLIVFDLAAEVFSTQSGLSFASNYNPDEALPSGVVGAFLGLLGLALMFSLNLHLVAIDILFESFVALPPGQWPRVLDVSGIAHLLSTCFGIGVILSMPFIAINLVVMAAQGLMGRTSPQMNLFSIGFSIAIPISVFLIYILMPVFPEALKRSLEAAYGVIRSAFTVN